MTNAWISKCRYEKYTRRIQERLREVCWVIICWKRSNAHIEFDAFPCVFAVGSFSVRVTLVLGRSLNIKLWVLSLPACYWSFWWLHQCVVNGYVALKLEWKMERQSISTKDFFEISSQLLAKECAVRSPWALSVLKSQECVTTIIAIMVGDVLWDQCAVAQRLVGLTDATHALPWNKNTGLQWFKRRIKLL